MKISSSVLFFVILLTSICFMNTSMSVSNVFSFDFILGTPRSVSGQTSENPKVITRSDSTPGNQTSYRVTLITGDVISVTYLPEGQKGISVFPADPTRPSQSFYTLENPDGTYVLPSDVNLEKLDIELFNIDYLINEGYSEMSNLPIIVSTADAGDQRSIERAVKDFSGNVRSSFPRLSAFAVQLPLCRIKDSIGLLLDRADVEKIWLDRKVHVSLSESVPLIGAPELWDAGYDGTGVEIAILDTGIDDTHPDLDTKVIRAIDFTDDLTTDDLRGHGTHCAGIAAGTGAASGGINKGVAPGALLWNVKVLNQYGWGYDSWIISGIEYAAYGPDEMANTGDEAAIISMSLGGAPTDGADPMSLAVDAAVDAGVVVVIAAGNERDYFQISSPGVAGKVITVGASDKLDNIASFSSRGPTIDFRVKPDVLAPGVSINSSVPHDVFGTYYQSLGGTSMATPHVAGVAALMLQKGVPSGWSAPQYVKDALISTAVDLGYDVYTQGGGRIVAPSAAHTQILVDPATTSLGVYTEDTLDSVTLSLYNLNTTSSRVLTLSVTVYDMVAETQVDCVTLSATTIDIGPHSSTLILLTIDTNVTKSFYSGKLAANVDTGETIHAIFGFARLNEVIIDKVDLEGTPATDDRVWVIGEPGLPEYQRKRTDESGKATCYVADGNYHIISHGDDNDLGATIYTVKENISITANAVFHLDERETFAIDFDMNKPDQIMAEKFSAWFYEAEEMRIYFWSMWNYPASTLTYVSPTSIDIGFAYCYYPEAHYDPVDPFLVDTPEWHKPLFTLEEVTEDTTFVADYSSLVQRTTECKVTVRSDEAQRVLFAYDPIAWVSSSWLWRMRVPQSRVEWLSPEPTYYSGWYSKWDPLYDWDFSEPGYSHPPGSSPYLAIGEHPFTSGADVHVETDYLLLNGSISTDTFGNSFANFTRGISGNLTVIQDGIEIYRAEIWDYFWQWISFSGTPKFTVIIEGSCDLDLSTSTLTELTFTADQQQDYQPPQVAMRSAGSNLSNVVQPGEVLVNVTTSDDSPISSVGLEYSLDDGTTWNSATETVNYDNTRQFSLSILGGDAYISLKVCATDSIGNSISQTTIRGFYVAPFQVITPYDIAVISVKSFKTVVGQGHLLPVDVIVQNQGNSTETFGVTLYANATTVETEEITLTSGNYTTVAFTWNTTGFAKGNYTISVYTPPLPGETDIADNTYTDGTVRIGMPGDVNCDGKVNIIDIASIARAYDSSVGHPRYNPNYDINCDGVINIMDIATAARNYGKQLEEP